MKHLGQYAPAQRWWNVLAEQRQKGRSQIED
jgi:hypothetical protein